MCIVIVLGKRIYGNLLSSVVIKALSAYSLYFKEKIPARRPGLCTYCTSQVFTKTEKKKISNDENIFYLL